MKNKWISVLKKMPPTKTKVLIWRKYYPGYIEEPEIAVLGERLDDSWLTAYWCKEENRHALCHAYNEDGSPSDKEVSHWMPIPDKPIENKKYDNNN